MNLFGDAPSADDIISIGRNKVTDVIGNKGLVLRKGIGTVLRIANQFSPIGSGPKAEQDFRPQRETMWDFVLPDMINGTNTINGIDVMKYCQAVRFKPYKIRDKTTIKYGPFQRSYPGILSVDNLSATFICSSPDIVGSYLRTWFNAVINEKGEYSPKITYVRKASVVLYTRSEQVNIQFDLNGLFPLDIGTYDLSYQGKSYVKYDVEFSVDTVVFKNNANISS